ncbi:apolipoprotein D-like [Palaemon carinicauda]|uniref:apolipoprotein D-like n=1 Tax=Palaemon carinicauda TaxID=392227 RepID=UPI0035B5E0A7
MIFLILSFFVGASLGQDILPGSCPEFITKTDFTTEPYLGKWFEIARIPQQFQQGQVCNYAEYTDRGDGSVGVHNAGLEEDGSFTEIFGYAKPTEVPGSLALYLDGVPFAGRYEVLETDYETYASVYSCLEILGIGHINQGWILGRNSALSPEELQTAKGQFDKWGIDSNALAMTQQEPCEFP